MMVSVVFLGVCCGAAGHRRRPMMPQGAAAPVGYQRVPGASSSTLR